MFTQLKDRSLIFGLPGAFTPTCSKSMLPRYEEMYDDFIDTGIVDEVYCLSVNDAYVMQAWFEKLGIQKVKPLSDFDGEMTTDLALLHDMSDKGLGHRCIRSVIYLDSGNEVFMVEEDISLGGDPYDLTKPEKILAELHGIVEDRFALTE